MTADYGYFQFEIDRSIRGLTACQSDDKYQMDIKTWKLIPKLFLQDPLVYLIVKPGPLNAEKSVLFY